MKKLLKISALLIVTAIITVGCRSGSIYNVKSSKIENPKSSNLVYKAIRNAGSSLGWKIKKIRPGVAEGRLYLRKHLAVVRINYSRSAYSINYVRSENLKYDAEKQTIHSNYNGWVQNLEQAIEKNLYN